MPLAADLPAQTQSVPRPAQVLYVSLELSPSKWLVTSLLSGTGRMSKHLVTGGDGDALLRLLAALRTKAEQRAGAPVVTVAIQEAGLDGFCTGWLRYAVREMGPALRARHLVHEGSW